MTRTRTVARRAPGKLFVAGEYAVVEPGVPAVLVAVDRDITVTVSGRAEAGVQISSDLTAGPVPFSWDSGRLDVGGPDGPQARRSLAHVVSAVETTAQLLGDHGRPLPAMSVAVDSRLHEDGRKYGLGSSGAVTVATVAAVADFCGLELTLDQRFRLALLATARLDAKGSGGDLAASTWGGWITYRAPDRAFVLDLARRHGIATALREHWPHYAIRRLPPPAGLSLEVGWTGSPASTTSLVAQLHRKTWRHSPSHRAFIETSTDIVDTITGALHHHDGPGLLEQIRRARKELARLDDEAALGIYTTELTALCDAAEAVGGAAKPSGAGGGDCGIALLPDPAPHNRARLRQRWTAAGVLPLPLSPATERNNP